MQLFVTGGTGYLGEALVRILAKKFSVRMLVHERPPRFASQELTPIPCVTGDLENREFLKEAVAGCDVVIHLAALVKTWVPEGGLFEKVNVEGFRNLAEVSWQQGVRSFIYTSSFLALEPIDPLPRKKDFPNPYALSKKKALSLARAYQAKGYPLITVIPTVLYGPGGWTEGNHISRLLKALLSGRFPGWIDGGKWRWNFAYLEDVVEGYCLVLDKGKVGEEYLLGGEIVSLRDFFTLASEIAGCPVPRRELSDAFLSFYATCQEGLATAFSREPTLTRGILATYRHHWAHTDEKARRELGYATTPLKEGLAKTIQWLKEKT